MPSAVDGDAHDAEPPPPAEDVTMLPPTADEAQAEALRWTRAFVAEHEETIVGMPLDDMLAVAREASIDEESVRRALAMLGLKQRGDGRLRRRPGAGDSETDDEPDAETVAWTRAFLDAKAAEGVSVSLDELLRSAEESGVDRTQVQPALTVLGVPARPKRVGWRARKVTREERRAEEASIAEQAAAERASMAEWASLLEPPSVPEVLRPDRLPKRVPEGKIHILSAQVDDRQPGADASSTIGIAVRIGCDEPGRLRARVVVRGGVLAEVEAVAPEHEMREPGELVLRCDVPAGSLFAVKHHVDVEAWLDTPTDSFATMHLSAQRFLTAAGNGLRACVRVEATWAEVS
jgi:hypothetical protein